MTQTELHDCTGDIRPSHSIRAYFANIVRKHCIRFHYFVDDTHLCLSMTPDGTNQIAKLQACT